MARRSVKATANATVEFRNLAFSISRSAFSLAEEAWRGVDLHRLEANASALRWYQVAGLSSAELMDSPMGVSLREFPDFCQQRLLDAIGAAAHIMPHLQFTRRHFRSSGDYVECEFVVQLFGPYIGVQAFVGTVSFEARWANPVWDLFKSDVSASLDSMTQQVHEALDKATAVKWRHSPLPAPHALSLPPPRRGWFGAAPWDRRGSSLTSGKWVVPVNASQPERQRLEPPGTLHDEL